eukprot:2861446-Amphidinium_carterae.1
MPPICCKVVWGMLYLPRTLLLVVAVHTHAQTQAREHHRHASKNMQHWESPAESSSCSKVDLAAQEFLSNPEERSIASVYDLAHVWWWTQIKASSPALCGICEFRRGWGNPLAA